MTEQPESQNSSIERTLDDIHSCEALLAEVEASIERLGLDRIELGRVEGRPINMYVPQSFVEEVQRRLVIGIMHGDEPAGGWGIAKYLRKAEHHQDMSFLPVASPYLFELMQREYEGKRDPNRGFPTPANEIEKVELTPEGEILMKHMHLLKEASAGGVLDLHENDEMSDYYMFVSHDNDQRALECAKAIVTEASQAFSVAHNVAPDSDFPDDIAQHGIIDYDSREGSALVDLLSVECGITAITSETPSTVTFSIREEVNAKIIRAFEQSSRSM